MKKVVIIVAGVFVAAGFFFAFKVNQFYRFIYNPASSKENPLKLQYNILLLGYGGEGHDGPYLTDSMMLVRLDLTSKKAVLISIPRDIWLKIPTNSGQDFYIKINALYQMGILDSSFFPDVKNVYRKDALMVKKGVFDITGLAVDNYIGVDFSAFTNVIDILGGVDINVQKTFDDYEYPIDGKENDTCGKAGKDFDDAVKQATIDAALAFPCRYEHLHFDKGLQHMDGVAALKYVRSRHSLQDGTDYGRAQRQQLLLEAVKEKVLGVGFIPKILPLMDELKNHIRTDLTPAQIQQFLAQAPYAKQYTLSRLAITSDPDNYLSEQVSPDGQDILIPLLGIDRWDNVKTWLATTSSTLVKPTSPP